MVAVREVDLVEGGGRTREERRGGPPGRVAGGPDRGEEEKREVWEEEDSGRRRRTRNADKEEITTAAAAAAVCGAPLLLPPAQAAAARGELPDYKDQVRRHPREGEEELQQLSDGSGRPPTFKDLVRSSSLHEQQQQPLPPQQQQQQSSCSIPSAVGIPVDDQDGPPLAPMIFTQRASISSDDDQEHNVSASQPSTGLSKHLVWALALVALGLGTVAGAVIATLYGGNDDLPSSSPAMSAVAPPTRPTVNETKLVATTTLEPTPAPAAAPRTNAGGTNVVPLTTKLLASNGMAGDLLGCAVAVNGDTVVVGAYGYDNSRGSVSVFVRSSSPGTASAPFNQVATLTASDGAADDRFGYNVAISGDTIVVSAHLDNDLGTSSGAVFVYTRSSLDSNIWTEQQKLTASDGAADDKFGWTVAIDSDTIVIGSQNSSSDSGAYIFTRLGTTWTQEAKLTSPDAAARDFFGCCVGISGDFVVIGAPGDDDQGTNWGSAFVFKRSGTTWTQQAKLLADDGAVDDKFGWSVAISGATAAIGEAGSGSAYVVSL